MLPVLRSDMPARAHSGNLFSLICKSAGMACLSVALAPTVAAIPVMVPVIVAIVSIIPVALAVTIIAPLVPGMSIIPVTILIPEGDASKVGGDSAPTMAAIVSSVSVRHAA